MMRIEYLFCHGCKCHRLHRRLEGAELREAGNVSFNPDLLKDAVMALAVCFDCRRWWWHVVFEAQVTPGLADVFLPFSKER